MSKTILNFDMSKPMKQAKPLCRHIPGYDVKALIVELFLMNFLNCKLTSLILDLDIIQIKTDEAIAQYEELITDTDVTTEERKRVVCDILSAMTMLHDTTSALFKSIFGKDETLHVNGLSIGWIGSQHAIEVGYVIPRE